MSTCCRLPSVVSWSFCRATHGLPCSGTDVPWVSFPGLAGTHRCATESRVTPWQSANPCCVLLLVCLESCVPSASCATENTYTPARLEALFKLSIVHSQSFVSFPPHFLRVVGALSNSSSCSTRSSSHSRSRRNFRACCRQCRNPSCSRECKSVSFCLD